MISKGIKDKIIDYAITLCKFDRKMHSGLVGWPGLLFFFSFWVSEPLSEGTVNICLCIGGPLYPQEMRGGKFPHRDNRSGSSSNTELTHDDAVRTQIYSTAPPRGSAASAWNSHVKMIERLKNTFVFWSWCLINRGMEATACESFILKEK